jgi:DNA invertase Pin-like site-specific DNA recombinase
MTKRTDGGKRKGLKPAVGYIRVSDVGGRGGESFRSPAQQRARIEELAAAAGYYIAWWIEELDVSGRPVDESGARFDRPRWAEAEELVVSGAANAIIVYDLKRFGRETAAMLATRKRLAKAGGELLIGDLPVDVTTPTGKAMFGVLSVFAELDGDVAAGRFEESKRDAWNDGIYLATRAPFGYRFVDEESNRRLVLDPGESMLVRELFERRAGGASWTELLELFELRTGRSVSRQTVRELIRRRAYLGESPLLGAWKRSPNGHAAIVTAELFEAAQRPSARWKATSKRERFDGRVKYLLSGIARCGTCGSKMHGTPAGSKGRVYYRCTSRACEARANVLADELDAHVEDELRRWAEPIIDEPVEVELETIAGELVEERREELVRVVDVARLELQAFAVGARGLSAGLLQAGLEARELDVELAVQELEDFDRANVGAIELAAVRTTLRTAQADLDLDVAERRRLIAVVLERVIVDRGRIVNARRARLQPVAELVPPANFVYATAVADDRAELLEEATA